MNTLSLRARLTLWYTLVIVVVLSLFGANVLWVQGRIGLSRVDRTLDEITATLASIIEAELKEDVGSREAADEGRRAIAAEGRVVAIFDAQGVPLSADWGGLAGRPLTERPSPVPKMWTEQTPAGAWRVHARTRRFDTNSLVLLVASPLAEVHREQREVQQAMWLGVPIVLLLASGGGFWLASIGLRPISDMARQAARISLSGVEALGPADRRDELGQFARAFNSLVDRLRAALHTQRQFMADASHELRTPVSIIRTTADVTLGRDRRDETEYREALVVVGDQPRRLSRLVDAMLVLARADAGGYPLRSVDLYLDDIVTDCCRAVGILAREGDVAIQWAPSTEIPFRGDEDLLRQAMLNVVQNAVQHTPPGGRVSLETCAAARQVSIRVTDSGPGILPADQERIFDRFVQLDLSRRGQGAGLGLSIARWIAEAHHGTLTLESSGPTGSTFLLRLPRTDAEAGIRQPARVLPA